MGARPRRPTTAKGERREVVCRVGNVHVRGLCARTAGNCYSSTKWDLCSQCIAVVVVPQRLCMHAVYDTRCTRRPMPGHTISPECAYMLCVYYSYAKRIII